jgi:uncharacterized OB-fold protein
MIVEKTMLTPARTLRGQHDEEFWRRCNVDQLAVQRCSSCEKLAWPPVESCEFCGSPDFGWWPLSGKGALRSYCTFERQYFPEYPPPWSVILVELEEGIMFISVAPSIARDALSVGMALIIDFIPCEDEHGPYRLPVFSPVS